MFFLVNRKIQFRNVTRKFVNSGSAESSTCFRQVNPTDMECFGFSPNRNTVHEECRRNAVVACQLGAFYQGPPPTPVDMQKMKWRAPSIERISYSNVFYFVNSTLYVVNYMARMPVVDRVHRVDVSGHAIFSPYRRDLSGDRFPVGSYSFSVFHNVSAVNQLTVRMYWLKTRACVCMRTIWTRGGEEDDLGRRLRTYDRGFTTGVLL